VSVSERAGISTRQNDSALPLLAFLGFTATVLWRVRVASCEMQGLLWSTLGLLFGWLTERDLNAHALAG
jgi:hypothetical protein